MAGSFYPQSGVVRRAQSVAPPAPAARTTPAPLTGLPHAVGLLARDDLDRGERAALGNLGLYGVAAAELGPRTRVVDVGCGDGLGAEWLTRYYQDVVAIDSSVSAAESARRNAPRATVHCADFVTESALGRAEAAVAIDVLGYVPAPEDVLAALQRALTPDAVVFLAEPRAHVAQCPAPPIRRAFSHRSLTTLLTMSGYEVSRWLDAQDGFVCCLATPMLDDAAHWLSRGYQQLAARALDDALSSFERAEGSPRKPVQLESAIGEAECFLSQRKRGAAIDAFCERAISVRRMRDRSPGWRASRSHAVKSTTRSSSPRSLPRGPHRRFGRLRSRHGRREDGAERGARSLDARRELGARVVRHCPALGASRGH